MRDYKNWTGKQRELSLAMVNKAKALGLIQLPTKCNRCPQTEGIIQLHCENYDFTTTVLPKLISGELAWDDDIRKAMKKALEPLCWRCHMVHHSIRRAPAACQQYWLDIKSGKIFAPVYKHNFAILAQQHGIF